MAALFDVSTKRAAPLDADTSNVPQGDQTQKPAFITTQSLATFAGGSAAITILWKVAAEIFGWGGHWFPGVVAGVLGIYFFWSAIEGGELTGSQIMGAAIVALVNACVLWTSAIGIDVGLNNADVVDTAATLTGI
jgi:hypothetical protein